MENSRKNKYCLTNNDFRELLKGSCKNKVDSAKTSKKGFRRLQRKRAYKETYRTTDVLDELATKYRDRAAERREGRNPDYTEQGESVMEPRAYRSVAPNTKMNQQLALHRKTLIQESKYLGGDMAHTHLVKGLDYALLNKIRTEIETNKDPLLSEEGKDDGPRGEFKTQLARNVCRILFEKRPLRRNPLFAPGKMTYVVDVLEEDKDNDIPTTVVRSEADIPLEPSRSMVITDEIVEKLGEVLRNQGRVKKKKVKVIEHHQVTGKEEESQKEGKVEAEGISRVEDLLKRLAPVGYKECYPDMEDEDSDEGADLSKIDPRQCNGHLVRWDFENEEDYSNYMNNKEVPSRAAFQYGVKKSNGRRTRRSTVDRIAFHKEWSLMKRKIEEGIERRSFKSSSHSK